MQDPDAPTPSKPDANGNCTTTPAELQLSGYDLKIRSGGSWDVPQSSLVELKTMRVSNRPIWKRDYPQLFLSHTPHSYDDGKITEVQPWIHSWPEAFMGGTQRVFRSFEGC